ncbi:MAG: AAA family ATPase [Chloroflexota bacterium]
MLTDPSTNMPGNVPFTWDNLPDEIKARQQFVLWRYEPRSGTGKPSKVPYNPYKPDRKASVTDSTSWGAFEAAVSAYNQHGFSGVGYVLTADDPYVGIDLDHCRSAETGEVEPWAQRIINRLNSYTEVSPSGQGIRIIVEATLPNRLFGNRKGYIEMYGAKRYVSVTGWRADGTRPTIEYRFDEINEMHRELFGTTKTGAVTSSASLLLPTALSDSLSDERIITLAGAAKNHARFLTLWSGDIGGYPSHSEADSALCAILAFYTRDADQIDRLVRVSSLARDKWHDRQDYRDATIRKALTTVQSQYHEPAAGYAVASAAAASTACVQTSAADVVAIKSSSDTGIANQQKAVAAYDESGHLCTEPGTVAIYDESGHLCTQPGFVRMSDVVPEHVRWLWPGRIPLGKLTILDGDPGLGKSLVTLDIGARVTTGRAMPDGQLSVLGAPAGVVLLCAEDDLADTIRPRLDAAGANVARVVAVTHVVEASTERFPTILDIPELESAITMIGASLLIIDPIMSYLPSDVNSNRDQDVRRAMMPLIELAQRTGVAVLVVRHLNKQANSNPLYRGGGSIGMIGAARSGLLIAADPDDTTQSKRILVRMKSNSAATVESLVYRIEAAANGVGYLQWLGTSRHTAHSVLAAPPEAEDRSAIDDAVDFLRDVLKDGAQPSHALITAAKDAGVAEKTLRRAKSQVGVIVERQGYGAGGTWIWRLPEQGHNIDGQAGIDGQANIDGHNGK